MKSLTTLTAASVLALTSGLAIAGPDKAKSDTHEHKAQAADHADLRAKLPEVTEPALWFGSDAPELTISEWVKGDPVSEFEPGRVYVVEFWATWCGPCIAAFPHLSEIQSEMADDVTIIGVNIWERVEGAERSELVTDFVAEQADRMAYTVAIEEDKSMAENWMKAGGRNGIPSAFIVDQQGKIAWQGHPGQMDEPLAQIVAGTYDSTAAEKEALKGMAMMTNYQFVMNELRSGDSELGYNLLSLMSETDWAEEPMLLNAFAWATFTSDKLSKNHDVSLKVAKAACEATNYENPAILDTLARGYFEMGKFSKAVKWQTKAIELESNDDTKIQYQEALDKYTSAANKG